MVLELGGEALDDPLDVRLDEVVVETDVPPELRVGLGGSVGHLDDETMGSLRAAVFSISGIAARQVIRCVWTPI